MQYSPYEKEQIRKLLNDISWEHRKQPDMDSDSFAWFIWQKIEPVFEIIVESRDKQYIKLLEGLLPEKRGQEECDCRKDAPVCGCRVDNYNELIEELEYSVELIKNAINDSK